MKRRKAAIPPVAIAATLITSAALARSRAEATQRGLVEANHILDDIDPGQLTFRQRRLGHIITADPGAGRFAKTQAEAIAAALGARLAK